MPGFFRNYVLRHQHPANMALHAIGLPVTFLLPFPLIHYGHVSGAIVAFVVGYLMQFAGHAIEGNDAGEVILVKKWVGLPSIDIVEPPNQSTDDG